MAGERSLADQIRETITGMTLAQRVVVAAISLAAILAMLGLGLWASQESLDVLYSKLPAQDANAIVEQLKKMNIRFELSQDQTTVLVPDKRVGELRLKFAGEGFLKGESVGFEKLEAPGLTTTDFSQKVIHRRALEKELAKSIMSLQQVTQATVHITPGDTDNPFVDDRRDAKASVLLKLKGNKLLPDENTQAIVNLVAGSVEGLKPESVVVIDQYSRTLSRTGQDPLVGASDGQKKLQRQEEEHLVRKVVEMLEPVVGLGKVRATARIELDFDKVQTQEEKFDPQSQVERSINTKEEKITKRDSGAGVPGTPTNVAPANAGAAAGVIENSEKKESTTNFEISKTIQKTDRAPGAVKRLSLAVVVDNAISWEKDPKGEPIEKTVPRAAEELKKIKDQVAAAVGIQDKRGDQLTVENLAFAPTITPKEELALRRQFWIDLANEWGPKLVYAILIAAIFFMVVLPMLKRLSSALSKPQPLRIEMEEAIAAARRHVPVKTRQELEAEIEAELEASMASQAPEVRKREVIKRKVTEAAHTDPEGTSALIRSWLLEER